MRRLLIATALLPTVCWASVPQGSRHGAWHVVSISSLSGASGDDASVVLAQEIGQAKTEVRWLGRAVTVSFEVSDCGPEGSFQQGYSVPAERWLAQSSATLSKRLTSDLGAWAGQARLVCEKPQSSFDFDKLPSAVRDFTDRARRYSGLGATR